MDFKVGEKVRIKAGTVMAGVARRYLSGKSKKHVYAVIVWADGGLYPYTVDFLGAMGDRLVGVPMHAFEICKVSA